MATVSGLVPSRPCPGWTLVSRAISRAACATPLNMKTAAGQVDDPDEHDQKMMIANANSTRPWPSCARAGRRHGVTVTVRVRVSFPPELETTRVIV